MLKEEKRKIEMSHFDGLQKIENEYKDRKVESRTGSRRETLNNTFNEQEWK